MIVSWKQSFESGVQYESKFQHHFPFFIEYFQTTRIFSHCFHWPAQFSSSYGFFPLPGLVACVIRHKHGWFSKQKGITVFCSQLEFCKERFKNGQKRVFLFCQTRSWWVNMNIVKSQSMSQCTSQCHIQSWATILEPFYFRWKKNQHLQMLLDYNQLQHLLAC